MTLAKKANKFEILSGRDQILKRPGMWIGSMDTLSVPMFIIDNNKAERTDVEFIPAFKKIIDEIIDNSLDAIITAKTEKARIRVKMTSDTITVEDNGPGIPVIKKNITDIADSTLSEDDKKRLSNTYLPEIAWTRLFTGTNFQNSDDKITVGAHGIGSKATAIFSAQFIGRTSDGKKTCIVTAKNNLEHVRCTVKDTPDAASGTRVEFKPDLARFNMSEIDKVYQDLIYQRLICLSITFPDITFVFNNRTINVTARKFMSMFSDNAVFQTFDRGFIGVYHNEADEFNFFTYVNGLALTRGGSHVDYIIGQLVGPVRDKLIRRYRDIKPADVRNRLSLVVFMRDFPNAKYDSQTKETLTNAPADVSKYFNSTFDFTKLSNAILRNASLIDPIIETFKLKEEVKHRLALKHATATRTRVKIDASKYISATGTKQQYLLLCEGMSACSGISQALGRNGIAYYASRGVPLNVNDVKLSKIVKNTEFIDIMSILGINPNTTDNDDISFDTIVHAADSDIDGMHIFGIYMGWWAKFAPELFAKRKIARLMTPYIILWADSKMTKIHKAFFDMQSYKEYALTHDVSKYKKNLFKGLGSWSKDQFQRLFDTSPNGIEDYLQYMHLDSDAHIYISDWLDGGSADKRKQHLRQYTLDIDTV